MFVNWRGGGEKERRGSNGGEGAVWDINLSDEFLKYLYDIFINLKKYSKH